MWTVLPSPIGDLRIIERDGKISAIEFSPFRQPATVARSAPAPTTTRSWPRQCVSYRPTSPATSPSSTCHSPPGHRLPAGSGSS